MVRYEAGESVAASYNTELEQFEQHISSVGMVGNIATQIHWTGTRDGAIYTVIVNQETVVGRIYPA